MPSVRFGRTEMADKDDAGNRQLSELPAPPAALSGGDDGSGPSIKEMFSIGFPVEQQREVLAEYEQRRGTFREWLRKKMVEGVHYGYPPGTLPKRKQINGVWHFEMYSRGKTSWVPESQWKHKPSLYKAGAQLLVDLFQLEPRFRASEAAWKMLGGQPGDIVMECTLLCVRTKREVGHGVGAGRRHDSSKDYDGKGANSAIKMANKRALVAAVLEAFGLSDLFTQDIEDGKPEETQIPNPKRAEGAPDVKPREGKSDPGPRREPGKVSEDDLRLLYSQWKKATGSKATGGEAVQQFGNWCRENVDDAIDNATDPVEWDRGMLSAAKLKLDLLGAGDG